MMSKLKMLLYFKEQKGIFLCSVLFSKHCSKKLRSIQNSVKWGRLSLLRSISVKVVILVLSSEYCECKCQGYFFSEFLTCCSKHQLTKQISRNYNTFIEKIVLFYTD